jgi:DNA-binding NarL/FixJ family response regulator
VGLFGISWNREEKWQSINRLEEELRVQLARRSQLDLREKVKIVAIDDQAFAPETNLRNNHFDISVKRDLHDVNDIKDYSIILCDLEGVGAALNHKLQGAHLIKEIKAHFPQKIVIAYTGVNASSIMARTAQSFADHFLKKDSDIDDWIAVLDGSIKDITNPVYMWRDARKRMLDAGLTPFQLARLEDAYVKSILRKDEKKKIVKELNGVTETLVETLELKTIINGLISAVLYSIVFA